MNPKLRVEIEADIKGMESALSKADSLLEQHQRNFERIQQTIGQNAQRARELERALQDLNNQYRTGAITEKRYQQETDRVSQELREVNHETSLYQKELVRLRGEMNRLAAASSNYAQAAKNNAGAIQGQNRATGQLAKTTRVNAVPAMTSFSQVIQDAPYGIQGVANNIQQLTMQLGYLTTNAGGTTKAMRAMWVSLAGPAGILLAVSLVTSAMTAMSQSGVSLGSVLTRLTNNADALARKLSEVARASADAVGQRRAEVAVIGGLIDAMQDETIARDKRLDAARQLRDMQPSILQGLTDEQALVADLAGEREKLTEALIRQAKIQGFQSAIADTYKEIARLGQEMKEGGAAGANFWDVLTSIAPGSNAVTAAMSVQRKGMGRLIDKMSKAEEEAKGLTESMNALIREGVEAGDYTTIQGEVVIKPKTEEEVLKELGIDSGELQLELDLENMIIDIDSFTEQVERNAEKINKSLNDAFTLYDTTKIEDAIGLASLNAQMETAEANFYGFAEAAEETDKRVTDASKRMDRAMQTAISSMVRSLIDGKFEAEDFAKTVISSLISVALTSLMGPGAGIFGSLFGGGGAQASLAGNSVRPMGLSLGSSPALSAGNSGAQMNIGVQDVVIDGDKLRIVMGRAMDRHNRVS